MIIERTVLPAMWAEQLLDLFFEVFEFRFRGYKPSLTPIQEVKDAIGYVTLKLAS